MPIAYEDQADAFVIVPAYNEGKVISGVVAGLLGSFPNVVVVDDGSSDDTAAVLRTSSVHFVRHALNLGQGAALQTGITYALRRGAKYIVTFDADGQHRIEDALRALHEVQSGGCDVACGSRFLGAASNIPTTRKLLLKVAVWCSNVFMRTKLTDAHNGLRAFNRRAAEALDISQNGMAHASEMIQQFRQHAMIIHEVPVHIEYTDYSLAKGQSSLNSLNVLIDLVISRFIR